MPVLRQLRVSFRPTNHARMRRQQFSSASVLAGVLGARTERKTRLEPKRKSLKPYNHIKIYPAIPSTHARCKDPIAAVRATQLQTLDPSGARTRLFDRKNPEAAKVGDILLVRQRNGDPFSGICMNIRRQGIDTAILLRNHLTRVGVEVWYKIYSPNVDGIEVVQRRKKRARRARLYYIRKPKHDVGSVENIVRQYIKQRQSLRSGSGSSKGRDANAHRRNIKAK